MRTSKPPERASSAPSPWFSLTRRQSLFWLDYKLFTHAPYHQIVLALRLRGELDRARFQRAYADTLLAFDALCLVFREEGGVPQQRVREAHELELTLAEIDLRERPAQLADEIEQRCTRRFDLTASAFDGVLFALGEHETVFYFCHHHIVADGISVSLFLTELARRYAGEAASERASFAEYVREEQAYCASPKAERDARYFAKRFGNGSPPLRLYGRAHESRRIAVDRSSVEGGHARYQQLTECSRDPRVEFVDASLSRLVAITTALFAYLARVSGERTLVIGTPLPNRTARFVETCGLLMEQAFLAVTLDDGETFASLAGKVRAELLAALRHGRHTASDRGLSYATLNLLRVELPRFAGLTTELELYPASASGAALASSLGDTRDTFGVHLHGFERDGTLRIGFAFHRDTFEPALQARAKRHFMRVLDALLSDLDTVIDHVALVDDEERALLLALGRGASVAAAPEDPLLRFLHTARAQPDATAVVFDDRTLSYGELAHQVGQLAARFRALGVTSGARVAFCLPRGPDELVTMLASWAVGAAYVPTDPAHPSERMRLILEDAAPDLVVSSGEIALNLGLASALRVLDLDAERAALTQLEPYFLEQVAPEQLAYVLFTSGSTGRPKGVAVPRRAFANFLRSMAHTPGMHASDRLLAVTTTTFDIAGLELHLPLWVGASVQIADLETVRDPALVRVLLEREPITVMQATPTTWRLLVEAGYRRQEPPLRMLCGGEALSLELAKPLSALGELWNMYGPTETTVWSTLARVEAPVERIPIGRPIDETQTYVLDALGEVVPLGVAGELAIGGLGVAEGYFRRPDLNEGRFVASRFGAPGERIYRTGDLGRLLEDGQLVCLGRLDHQVKIRGFRIELGEIETCLRGAPGVLDAVVTARARAEGDAQLVAYYVGATELASLREHARAHLPYFMQPAAYVALSELPLNTNGKVDRKQLPAVEDAALPSEGSPPSSNDEAKMAALFEQVLKLKSAPVDRDFFELGGDSVSVLELRRRVQESFGIELPLGVLFERPSVRHLVAALAPSLDPLAPAFVPLRAGSGDRAPLLCLLGVMLYRPLADALHTDRAVYGLHIPQRIGGARGLPSLESIAAGYVDLIVQKVPSGPYHLAGLCFGGLVAYEVARQLRARGADVRTVAVIDAELPRAVPSNPLTRARHFARELRARPRAVGEQLGRATQNRLRQLASLAESEREVERREVEREQELDVMSPIVREMVEAYDATRPSYPRSILVFRAGERVERAWRTARYDLGWADLAHEVSVTEIAGSHLAILKQPHVHGIADILGRALDD